MNRVISTLERTRDFILVYAVLLAGVGALSMAFLELIKGLFFLRRKYNRWQVREWIRGEGDERALNEMHGLAVGDMYKTDSLYDQPLEKVMGQIQAAANVAMEFPDKYERFYKFLTSSPGDSENDDRDLWLKFWKDLSKRKSPPKDIDSDKKKAKKASTARTRLSNLVDRRLDAFQTRAQYRWARINQLSSLVLGGIILFFTLLVNQDSLKLHLFQIIAMSMFGGILAPFAKDLQKQLSSIVFRIPA